MRQVPYHGNPGNACALACYPMVAQYLLPDAHITFEQLGVIAKWHPGYVIWAPPVYQWLMEQGICIADYDAIDYRAWAAEGVEGLKKSIPPKEFQWYQENTYDLDEVTRSLTQALRHSNFTSVHRKPSWGDVVAEYRKPGICDLVLNLNALNGQPGFVSHRVVLIQLSENQVVFHDPNADGSGAYRHEPLKHFQTVFESIESSELVRYSRA